MFNPTSPVVGPTTITGLTSPTYTLTEDGAPPDSNARQFAVTALGGTQTGVTTHSVASPFTVAFFRPKVLKTLGTPNPVTGVVSNVSVNVHKLIARKGVTVLTGQPIVPAMVRAEIHIPAGSDSADTPNLKALVALTAGVLQVNANEIVNTLVTGTL